LAGARGDGVSAARQAESLALAVEGIDPALPTRRQAATRVVVRQLRQAMRVNGVEFVRLDPDGQFGGTLPDGVQPADLDRLALTAGQTVSGANGSLVYAAAPDVRPRATVVADAARRIADGQLSTRLTEPAERDRDELAALTRSINAIAVGLERSRTLEQQFLLSVSHDLRTPPTSIHGYAAAINDGTAPDAREAAEVILGESRRLERLLANLLGNGRKYARARIDVHVRSATGMAVVHVDDDGPGIPSADRPFVFERLYVTRQRPERAEAGSGLGLAIVRQLAEAMGGSVGVEASPTGAARMEIRLPLAPHTRQEGSAVALPSC
jgi:signal transduction histidine kinase